MKKLLTIAALAVAALALPLLGWAGAVSAGDFKSGQNVVVEEDKTINRTLFASGGTIKISGTVDGDVICAGQVISVTGTVRGDVICAGQTVNIDGTVEGDVRVAGQSVTLGGDVDGNATIAGQNVTVEENATVADLTVGGTTVDVNGEVERDLYVGSENATIGGLVGRDVKAGIEHLSLDSNARVGGDLVYFSNNKLDRSEGAQVAGQVDQRQPTHDSGNDTTAAQVIGGILFALLLMLVMSMAIVALFPRVLQRLSTHAIDKPGTTFLIGLVAVVLTPVLTIALMITGVGVFLGLLILMAYLLLLFASQPVTGYYIGRLILGSRTVNPLLYMLLGVGILTLLYFVPFIGGLVMVVAAMFGGGMVVRETFRRAKDPQYDVSLMNRKAKPAKAKK